MSYVIEPALTLTLNFTASPFAVPDAALALVLEFTEGNNVAPSLPWRSPSLFATCVAPFVIARVAKSEREITLDAAMTSDYETRALFGRAVACDNETHIHYEQAQTSDSSSKMKWGKTSYVDAGSRFIWKSGEPVDMKRTSRWEHGQGKDRNNYVSLWIGKPLALDITTSPQWYSVNLAGSPYDDYAEMLASLNTDTALTLSLNGSSEPLGREPWYRVALSFGFKRPSRPIVPHDLTAHITARPAKAHDVNKYLPWGAGQSVWQDWNLPYPVDTGTVPPDPIDPPERKTVYLIMNTLQVIDIATSTPLQISNVQISLDLDSIAWKFSGTVYGQGSLDLVRPDEDGMKDIQVTINTHQWIFSIERYTSDEKFPSQKFTITGVSRTQYMAAPYAPVGSYTNASTLSAAQACNAVLENTGFTLDWPTGSDGDLPDWSLPSGALSYRDKSPAQIIAQIVTAAGGVMIPNMASDTWTIQPRYTIPPWQWDSITPDAAIYIGMVRSRSAQYEPGQAYDACYVSGINQGVAVDVQLAGSGGLNPMPDIFDDLITDSQPAISRGRNELASSGNKVVETLSVVIPEAGAAPGVLIPGQIVSVTHDDEAKDYIALVLSTSISVQRAGGAEIFQNVTLERRA